MRFTGLLGAGVTAALLAAAPAHAENFLGQILMSSYGACPLNTRLANGDLLPVQASKSGKEDYRDLYALLGTAYGGDGKITFALPDMRAQVIAMNNLVRAPRPPEIGKPPVDEAMAMQARLPIVFCIVVRVAEPGAK